MNRARGRLDRDAYVGNTPTVAAHSELIGLLNPLDVGGGCLVLEVGQAAIGGGQVEGQLDELHVGARSGIQVVGGLREQVDDLSSALGLRQAAAGEPDGVAGVRDRRRATLAAPTSVGAGAGGRDALVGTARASRLVAALVVIPEGRATCRGAGRLGWLGLGNDLLGGVDGKRIRRGDREGLAGAAKDLLRAPHA